MANNNYIEQLCFFGLTRQEAAIYEALLTHGEMTGYEVAKETGISRSNVYAALSALVEKGAAYLIEGDAAKYTPVEVKRFTANTIAELQEKAAYLEKHAPQKAYFSDGYITVLGSRNIRNKIREMIEKTELRLYILAPGEIISEFDEPLKQLVHVISERYDNLNYFLKRVKKYNPVGRLQTEAESDQYGIRMDGLIKAQNLNGGSCINH